MLTNYFDQNQPVDIQLPEEAATTGDHPGNRTEEETTKSEATDLRTAHDPGQPSSSFAMGAIAFVALSGGSGGDDANAPAAKLGELNMMVHNPAKKRRAE